jgi:hypothetical protein
MNAKSLTATQDLVSASMAGNTPVIISSVDALLASIRPDWQAKSLIKRVKGLLPVDPSSACQRLLNAAIHDLREKIIIAGLDVAQEAASSNGLPQAKKPERSRSTRRPTRWIWPTTWASSTAPSGDG